MIVSTSLAKVGHRQAPHSKTPLLEIGRGFYTLLRPNPDLYAGLCSMRRIRSLNLPVRPTIH